MPYEDVILERSVRTYVRLLPVPGPEHSVLISALRDFNDKPSYGSLILLITASLLLSSPIS